MTYKELLGLVATLIAFVSYIPYFRDIFQGRTKPHAFSWLIWGVLTGIGFFGQLAGNAGPGAWVTGFTAIICAVIAVYANFKGKRNIAPVDWLFLAGAGLSLYFWYLTKDPFISVVLITIIDALGFLPTFRKSFNKPHEETASTYALSGFKFVLSLFALNNFSVITALYPASLVLMNWIFVVMVFIRRRQLHRFNS